MHLNLEVNRITTCNNTMIPDIEKHVTHQAWRKNENYHDCSREVSRDIQIFFCKQTTPPQTSRKCEMQTNAPSTTHSRTQTVMSHAR